MDQLDLGPIHAVYEKEMRGQPPYDPPMMTKLLVYGYCVGVYSARRIQRQLVEDVAFRVLAGGNQPDFRTISDFRKIHLQRREGFCQQVRRITLEAGAMKLGRVALDGTKRKANASKHKAMSYARMKEQEQRIAEQLREMLAKAEATDAAEDERYGKDNTGDQLPEELQRRETRLRKIREAMKAWEERARAEAEAAGKPAVEAAEAEPKDKAQHNFTDPESRIRKSKEGFVQAYNAQIAVEPDFPLIVGQAVTQACNDKQQVAPIMEAVEEQSGPRPASVLADSGYGADENLAYLAAEENPQNRIEADIATGRRKHGEEWVCRRGPLPATATRVDRMTRRLQTKAGAAAYAARKAIVEPVFGQIKEARGFQRFSLRGLEKVRAEWALVCTTHNILKIYRLCQA